MTDVTPSAGPNASLSDKTSESAQAGKQAAADVASTAVDKAQEVAAQAKDQARDLMGEARGQLRGQASDQKQNAVSSLRSLGDELRSMAQNSRTSGDTSEGAQAGIATDLVGQGADRAHSVADWLDSHDPDDILAEARRFAQRRPGTFLLGALAAGIVAGRLTRGVVAAHQDDDSPDSLASTRSAGPSAPSAAVTPDSGQPASSVTNADELLDQRAGGPR